MIKFVILLLFLLVLIVAYRLACYQIRSGAGEEKKRMFLGSGDYREVYIDNIGKNSGLVKYHDPVLGTIKTFNTRGEKYLDIHSNRQISQIVKYGSIADFTRLINLIYKKLDWKLGTDKRRKLAIRLAYSPRDDEVYKVISENMSDDFYKGRVEAQAESVYRGLIRIINKYYPDRKPDILDVGCGDGNITKQIKDYANLEKIHCVEIDSDILRNPAVSYKFVKPDSETWKLPYEDSSFDIVMLLMSLHHIKNHESYIKEIYRILRPGGFVFIKEHDSWTAFDAMLVDIEHAIYMYHDGNKDFKDYYVHHFNYWTQNEIFKNFEYIKGDYYYINIKNDLAPTRTMWAIERKPETPKEYERESLKMKL